MKSIKILALALAFVAMLPAQVATGRITGRVTDTSGGVVAAAAVKTVNILTNVEASTKTTTDGVFDILNLIPGQYRLEVDMAGFRRYSQGPLELHVGDVLNLQVALQVGSQTESVTVSSEAPLLDSASATNGEVIDTKRLVDLPLPASNPLVLPMLAPNVTTLVPLTNTLTPDANNQVADVAAAGTLYGQTMISIDGMPSMEGPTVTGIVPPPEVLQEVKVSTTPYDASLGHFTGAQIDMVTKSGTNDLHGALVFWNTNTDLNALAYFSKISIDNPATGPVTHAKIRSVVPYIGFNRYRGVIGGPLVIPKLYNGRNKTFWSYAGDYFFMPYSSNGFFTVPTVAERAGNFSALLALGPTYQIYDPYSAVATPGGHVARSPLPGNIIPASYLSPVAQNLLKYYPLPNTTGTSTGLNNYTGAPNSSIDMFQHFARVDQVISDNNRAFVSYNRFCLTALQNEYFGSINGTTPTGVIQDNCHQGLTADDVITPTPSWVLHFSYGLVRFISGQPSTSQGVNLASLGLSPQLISQVPPSLTTLPALNIDNNAVTPIGSASQSTSSQLYQNAFASATHIAGNHTVRFGIEFRTTETTSHSNGNLVPSYTFGTNWTTATDTAAPAAFGQGLASFLYGLPTTGTISRNDSYVGFSKMFAWYAQDDWRVTRKLTLNLGIRHELEFGETERFNRANDGFNFTVANPTQAAAQANYAANPIPQIPAGQFQVLGGQQFVSPSQRGIYNLNPLNLMPRVGIAYQLTNHTVIRAGYGMFYESFAADFVPIRQNGFSNSTTMVPSSDNGLSFQATLDNYPFPNGIQPPTGSTAGLNTFLGKAITFFDPNNKQAYDQRWSFDVQHQFGDRVLVDIGYTGNRATHLGTTNAWDSLPVRYLSQSPTRDTNTINMLGAQVANPFYNIPAFATTPLATPTVALSQLLMPYPEFTGVTSTDGSGFSWYHAMSARAEKRFSNGLTIQANYTWSKFMEADSRLNGIQSPLAHTISAADRPQQFSPNAIYELPFGKGRHFLQNLPGWADRIAGGWQADVLYLAQSGSPMAFGDVLFTGNLNSIALPKSQRTISEYFNVNAGFNTNSSQQLANNYRTFPLMLTGSRNPGYNMWSMSVIKRIPIKERINFEVRAEAKNALNHPNWGAPNLVPTSALFGQITSALTMRVITLQGKLNW